MSILWRINKKIKDMCAKPFRKGICRDMQDRLRNKEVSIVASNCIGGILSHDLGLQFASPTVNLFFTAGDFVRFATDIRRYIGLVPETDVKKTEEAGYLVAALGDIHLYAVHYHDIGQLQAAWKRRSARIHWNNLFFIMTDRNGMTEEDIKRFSELPYPKVLFSAKPYPQYDFVVWVDAFKDEPQVGQLQFYADYLGHRYYEKYFDFPGWLNDEAI